MIALLLNSINDILKSKLTWLDNAFGQAFRLIDSNGDYPAAHDQRKEYIRLFPNDILGNYSFFEVSDPIIYERNAVKFKASLIFWLNVENVYGPIGADTFIDTIREDIISALDNRLYLQANIHILGIYEQPESIFRGYSLSQLDTQYLMLPYHGYRIDLQINERKVC